jgi:thiol-disulfide isomerase/thioredoxin
MKKILLLAVITISLIGCKKETATFTKLSGKILNPTLTSLDLISMEDGSVIKSFNVTPEGDFSDTLTLPKGKYYLKAAEQGLVLYLNPGTDLTINLDTKDFDKSIKFDGNGKDVNNYILSKVLTQKALFDNIDSLYSLPKESFDKKIVEIENQYTEKLKSFKDFDAEFIKLDSTDTKGFMDYIKESFVKTSETNKLIGQPSPSFDKYENFKGGTTSLKDLKGKYVYVDVWATWCGPCKAEIPALKELEAEFGDKIHFVSISVDQKEDHEKWITMVTEKELEGVQLFADNSWESAFVQAYGINGIPRFILIDPTGNVVKPDASRPSNPKTKELFKNLLNLN